MKILNLFEGGHKFRNDDFTHIQNAIKEAVAGLVSPEASDNIILSGCEYDPASPGLTAGYIFMNGEIFQVDAKAIGAAYSVPVFAVVETTTTGSPVTYEDGNSRNVHLVRKADLQEEAAQSEKVALSSFTRLREYSGITLETGFPFSADPACEKYRGKVTLKGTVENLSGSSYLTTDNHVGTIDNSDFHPPVQRVFEIGVSVSGNADVRHVRIDTDGKIWVLQVFVGTEKIPLDGITYEL